MISPVNLLRTLVMGAVGLTLVVTIALNLNTFTRLEFFNTALPDVSVGLIIALTALGSLLIAGLKARGDIEKARSSGQKTQRLLEKMEVTSETSSEKVRALEAKIQSLEKALEVALRQQPTGGGK